MRRESLFVLLLVLFLGEVVVTALVFLQIVSPNLLLGVDLDAVANHEQWFVINAQVASDLFGAAAATLAGAFLVLILAKRLPGWARVSLAALVVLGPIVAVILRGRLLHIAML